MYKIIAGIGDVSPWSCHAPAALVHLTAHQSLNLFAVCWEVKSQPAYPRTNLTTISGVSYVVLNAQKMLKYLLR